MDKGQRDPKMQSTYAYTQISNRQSSTWSIDKRKGYEEEQLVTSDRQ
jgi:hypothetical protein